MSRRAFLEAGAVGAVGLLVVGCAEDVPFSDAADAAPAEDAALPDGAPDQAAPDADVDADVDAAVHAQVDAEPLDAAPLDAAPDALPLDAGPADAMPADAAIEPVDATVFDPAYDLPEVGRFPFGVASGDVTRDAAICWTRHAGDGALSLWRWPVDGGAIEGVPAHRADGGFVHVDVGGLQAGARYHYAFVELGPDGLATGRSPVGTFRVALPRDAREVLTFGAVSCTLNGFPFTVLEQAGARADLDLFLLVGDTVYADGAVDRTGYRDKWAQNFDTEGYRRLKASTSVLATWDDHEVGNNWNAESVEPAQRAAAAATLFEHLPLRRDEMAPDRLWKSMRWGQTAEFFVLDCRGERRPSTRLDADAEYLSAAQFDWLQGALLDSPARFKIIINSVPCGDFPYPAAEDRWAGYPAQRDALLTFLDHQVPEGVIFVSGDFHHPSAGRLTAQGPGSRVPEFLVGPGAQVPNPGFILLPGLPQFDWADGANNYTVFTLDPATGEVQVAWIDGTGRTVHEASYGV